MVGKLCAAEDGKFLAQQFCLGAATKFAKVNAVAKQLKGGGNKFTLLLNRQLVDMSAQGLLGINIWVDVTLNLQRLHIAWLLLEVRRLS
jgi:hypothetical protein